MKKIGLISDTHNFLHPKINHYFENCDEVWHAGDIGNYKIIEQLENKNIRGVYGNIDGKDIRMNFPKELNFQIEKVNVYITHIGGCPKKYSKEIIEKIKTKKPNLVICGHSHILKVMYDHDNQHLFINPGAAGKYGAHQKKTIIRFEINEDKIENLEVIELK